MKDKGKGQNDFSLFDLQEVTCSMYSSVYETFSNMHICEEIYTHALCYAWYVSVSDLYTTCDNTGSGSLTWAQYPHRDSLTHVP